MIKQLPLEKIHIITRCFFRNASWARWSHQVRGRLRNWCSYQNQMRKQRKVSEATEPSRWRQWCRSGMHHVLLSVWIKKKNLRAGSNCTWEEQQALLASTFKLWWQICCKNTGSGRRTEDQCWGMAVWYAPQRILGSMDVETAFDEATPRLGAQIMEDHNLREIAGLEGQAMCECVEVNFLSPDAFSRGASKLPDCDRRWPCSSWQKWKGNG